MGGELDGARALIKRYRRRAALMTAPGVGKVVRRVARSRLLPDRFRRRLDAMAVIAVAGAMPRRPNGLVTIVSHELAAAGAPKVLTEIVGALRDEGWAVVVVGPDKGPYLDILARAGAVVIVAPAALWARSPAVALGAWSAAIICNTIACIEVVAALPADKTFWYLHETGAVDSYRELHPSLPRLLMDVRDVWATSRLVVDRIAAERPDAAVIPASSEAVHGTGEVRQRSVVEAAVLGSIERRKGQDLLLDAYASLSADLRARLSIRCYGRVLEPDFARALEARVDRVEGFACAGAVSPEAAAEIIGRSDLVIVPSRDEPLSLVAVEALSASRVVLCTKAAGIAHFIEDGVSGYVAESSAPPALAEALRRALADRAAWPRVAAAGRRVYERDFTPAVFRARVMARLAPALADQPRI